MKIHELSIHSYQIPLKIGKTRFGAVVKLIDFGGNESLGDLAPLPGWSDENLEQAIDQLNKKKEEILSHEWSKANCLETLKELDLFPSVLFAAESALLNLLDPYQDSDIASSALFMGSTKEILQQAALRQAEGYTTAKLKVSQLTFPEAETLIYHLKDRFRLRIDVNRAWQTQDALQFFAQFSHETFDYVEEPFKNPLDLTQFDHPLAVDESFPRDLCLKQLEDLPSLKALIYKPTIQGGLTQCMPLYKWTLKKGISLILSSSFESRVGLKAIALMAKRLGLKEPMGLGTAHFMDENYSIKAEVTVK